MVPRSTRLRGGEFTPPSGESAPGRGRAWAALKLQKAASGESATGRELAWAALKLTKVASGESATGRELAWAALKLKKPLQASPRPVATSPGRP